MQLVAVSLHSGSTCSIKNSHVELEPRVSAPPTLRLLTNTPRLGEYRIVNRWVGIFMEGPGLKSLGSGSWALVLELDSRGSKLLGSEASRLRGLLGLPGSQATDPWAQAQKKPKAFTT
ncbi:unnamed protein product [Caenorhabditis brenneri]